MIVLYEDTEFFRTPRPEPSAPELWLTRNEDGTIKATIWTFNANGPSVTMDAYEIEALREWLAAERTIE
jgi:hypothetical protein